jgi:hypothetical protein
MESSRGGPAKAAMKLQFPQETGNFMSNCATISGCGSLFISTTVTTV